MVIRKNTIIAIAKAIPTNVSSPDITMNIHKIVRIIIGAVQPSGSHSGWPNCISAPFLIQKLSEDFLFYYSYKNQIEKQDMF